MFKTLEELHSNNRETLVTGISSITADDYRLISYFCSVTIFNLSNKVLSENEIKVLEKSLDFEFIQRKINEPELKSDFGEFCCRMKIKWHFRNKPTLDFSEKPEFHFKSSWNPPKGDPHLEVFVSRVEEELFAVIERPARHSNLSQEEWKAIRYLADDRNIVIKKADKGSCVVIWDRNDYITEAEKQLSDKVVYKQVSFKENNFCDLLEISNRLFRGLKLDGRISEKEMKYLLYEYKKVANLGKLHLLPKIRKRLYDALGRPVNSNCGTPAENVSEFLDHHLRPIIQEGWSYIKDTKDFLKKVQNIGKIPQYSILVAADVVGLYPSISHNAGLKALKDALDCRQNKEIPTDMLVKMAEFLLTYNYFEFGQKVFHQISGAAIGAKFAPSYAWIFMDKF